MKLIILFVVLSICVHESMQQCSADQDSCCGSRNNADVLFTLYQILFHVTSTTPPPIYWQQPPPVMMMMPPAMMMWQPPAMMMMPPDMMMMM